MKVCHVGTLPLERMSPNTRYIFDHTMGQHIYCLLGDDPPFADVYVLECFKKRWEEFRDFRRPHPGARIVSMMHSTPPAMPALESDLIVCQSNYSRYQVQPSVPNTRIVLVPSSVPQMQGDPQYGNEVFGRITRNAPGKFHPRWCEALKEITRQRPNAHHLLYVNEKLGLRDSKHQTVELWPSYDEQAMYLQRMSLAVFAHGDFEETFCSAVLEMMAAGLPVVFLYQPSLYEMVGDGQRCCGSIDELVEEVVALLPRADLKMRLGYDARERVRKYSRERMICAWNNILQNEVWT